MIKTCEKKSISWKAKQIAAMVQKRTARFDNAVQRTKVWDNKTKSLLIHSMIVNEAIPPLMANHITAIKDEKFEGYYDFVDGLQRTDAFVSFMNGEFALSDIPEVEDDEKEKPLDFNGMRFLDLPDEAQENIRNYMFSIVYSDNMTQEQVAERFYRQNNGKPMSSFMKARVRSKSLDKIQRLVSHPMFSSMKKHSAENIVFQSLAMLYMDEPCLDAKEFNPFIEDFEVTDEQLNTLEKIFNKIQSSCKIAQSNKIAKRIRKKSNFVTVVKFTEKHIDDEIFDYLNWFFDYAMGASQSTKYNDAVMQGANHAKNIKERLEAMDLKWVEYQENKTKYRYET